MSGQIEDQFQLALQHHQAGRLPLAEELYRRILQTSPEHPDALYLLGTLCHQLGNNEQAVELIRRAIRIDPSNPFFHDNLGTVYQAMNRLDEAAACYRQVIALEPAYAVAHFNLGNVLKRQGQPDQAAASYRQAISLNPDYVDAHIALGNTFKELGRHDEAIACYQKTLALNPNYAEVHFNLGIVLQEQGKLDEAIGSYRRALALRPDFAETHSNLGNALKEQGKLSEAIASYRQAILLKPDFVEAHNNLGLALKETGLLNEAAASHRQALLHRPDYAEAYNNLGIVLQAQGELSEAVACYQKALALKPDFAEAHNNLGNAFHMQGKLREALASCRHALSLKPDSAAAWCNLGNALLEAGNLAEAADCYHKAHALQPDNTEVLGNLATVYRLQGKLDEVRDCYRKAQAIRPAGEFRIAGQLLLPPIMGSRADVLESRTRFERNLDRLIAEEITLTDPYKGFGDSNFYLAFHGVNDRDIQQKISRLYEQACPTLLYAAPHCGKAKPAHSKVRIGFLSRFIYAHSVSRCFNRTVENLSSHGEFEIMLLSTHDHREESASKTWPGFRGTHVHLPNHLERAREKMATLELDILVYLDIGMEPLSYFLAFSRLARAQCVIGGHPVTTGIRNMDYFISSALAEPEDAEGHYSEQLVRLPIRPSYFERPVLPAAFKPRSALGLPEDGHIYACPMKLQKLHPDFDAAIARILQLDDKGYVVLFEDQSNPAWRTLLEKRYAQTIPDALRERILFLPWISDYQDFLSINKAADVVLDPFHFGIGSTAIATFAVGTPIVTWPGEFLRGRVGMQFCQILDVPECIAADTEDYARKAVAIATEPALRETIKSKILANSSALFDNTQTIEDLANFFRDLGRQVGQQNPR